MQHQRSARWLARASLLGIALLGRAALGQVPNATPAIARAMALQDDGRGGARSVDRAALEKLYSVTAARAPSRRL